MLGNCLFFLYFFKFFRENTLIAHIELKKKMEEIYSKLNNLGESSVLRKSNEDRREEFKNLKIEEEIKRLEEAEKNENSNYNEREIKAEKKIEKKKDKDKRNNKNTGFFSTEINY